MPVVRSWLTTSAALLSIALVTAPAACAPAAPSVDEYRESSSTLQKADKARNLRIGVTEQLPLMSEFSETAGWSGFEIEIATALARDLGFAALKTTGGGTGPGSDRLLATYEFIPLKADQRISYLLSGQIDLVIADFSMQEDRCQQIRCAGPYLIAQPEIMIRKSDAEWFRSIDDLRRPYLDPATGPRPVRVCTTGGSTTESVLKNRSIAYIPVDRGADCAEGVRLGTYDVHCTDDVAIAARVSRFPNELRMVDLPLGEIERLGVTSPRDDQHLQGLIAHFLNKQRKLGKSSVWQAAYDRYLLPYLGPLEQPSLIPYGQEYPELQE